ncbi:hypothetical protein BC835DRAFT_1378840 [Cytidiella melzeri]|nr:hypothetical protein BC835DRAFT_1378840 [Cytidiella melzeri]
MNRIISICLREISQETVYATSRLVSSALIYGLSLPWPSRSGHSAVHELQPQASVRRNPSTFVAYKRMSSRRTEGFCLTVYAKEETKTDPPHTLQSHCSNVGSITKSGRELCHLKGHQPESDEARKEYYLGLAQTRPKPYRLSMRKYINLNCVAGMYYVFLTPRTELDQGCDPPQN